MTKSKILKTATEEFSRYGYDGVSMNNLAAKLGINKATIYYYFKDKKTLYNEVLKNLIIISRSDMEEMANKPMEPKERFKNYISIYVKRLIEHPHIIPISLRELANSGNNVETTMVKEFERDMVYLVSSVSRLNLKERYKNLDFFALKSLILGTVNTYYSIQMSNLELPGLSDFGKEGAKIADYLEEFISNILLDTLCKD